MKICIFFIFLVLAGACTPSGPEQFRDRGTTLMRALVYDLKKVRSREELMDRQDRIKVNLTKLKSLIFETDRYLKSHPEVEIPLFSRQNQILSDELHSEINRLLRMEGCRELINQLITEKI